MMASLGDNSAVATPAELAADALASKLAEFEPRRKEVLATIPKVKVTDEDSTGRAAAVLKAVRAIEDAVWQRAKEVAQPYTEARDTVKARAENWLAELLTGMRAIDAAIEEYRAGERRRIADAQAQQRRVENALRAARAAEASGPSVVEQEPETPAARANDLTVGGGPLGEDPPLADTVPLAPLPAVRGDFGTLTSDRAKVDWEILDARLLPEQVLNSAGVVKALKAACRTYGRLVDTIPGAKKIESIGSVTRS